MVRLQRLYLDRGAETQHRRAEQTADGGAMPQSRRLTDHGGDRNRAVLVSVAQFDHGVNLARRPGAKTDTKKLHRTLSKLGFKVDVHTDLSGDEIYELFLKGTHTHTRYLYCEYTEVHRMNTVRHLLYLDLRCCYAILTDKKGSSD